MSVTGPQYQVIDTDPTFTRVVRYMRPTDYAIWAGFSVGIPSLLRAWGEYGRFCPSRARPRCALFLITEAGDYCEVPG